MAGERKRVAGELAAWHMGEIMGRISGERIDPARANPYAPYSPPNAAQLAAEKDRFWGRFRAGLGLTEG